jgi:hypothetical protein
MTCQNQEFSSPPFGSLGFSDILSILMHALILNIYYRKKIEGSSPSLSCGVFYENFISPMVHIVTHLFSCIIN